MADASVTVAPVLLLGAGRMGGAMLAGWANAGAFAARDLLIIDPAPGADAQATVAAGAQLAPSPGQVGSAATLVLCVKPQIWREIAAPLADQLAPDCTIVSVAAGVSCRALAEVFGDRPLSRVMPTTGVAIAQGVASIYAATSTARAVAHALLDPIAVTVDLEAEALIDAAIGVSGSAPAYFYAFVEAIEAAGVRQGLTAHASARLARATFASAGALLQASGADPAELRAQVTSPGGTTAAALAVLLGEGGLPALAERAIAAAVARSRALANG